MVCSEALYRLARAHSRAVVSKTLGKCGPGGAEAFLLPPHGRSCQDISDMRHPYDSRIDGLAVEIDVQARIDRVHPMDWAKPDRGRPSSELIELRRQRLKLVRDRWSDILATYGDPRKKNPRPQSWRGQPVARFAEPMV